jgi:methylenetetrahydrofolate dehydrogenase (NADP+) / methenyltetrahydrofolate cyclohydrolase
VPAITLNGTELSRRTRDAVGHQLRQLGGPDVCLTTVLVGDDAPSRRYTASKRKQAAEIGMGSGHIELPATASQAQVEEAVAALAADPGVHGILVQMPLPDGFDPERVLALVPADKDVDGLTPTSLGRLVRGQNGLVPCTPLGVMRFIEHYEIPTRGRRAVVLGRSTLVGLPVALLLAAKGVDATVTIAHSRSGDLAELCRDADILVSAVGQAQLVRGDWVKPGAAVFDVGISRTEAGIVGDVHQAEVADVAGWLTPMPGGTGPMTVACLLENTLTAARLQGVLPPR